MNWDRAMAARSIQTLVFYAIDAVAIADAIQSDLRTNNVDSTLVLIDQVDRVLGALSRDAPTVVAIIWTPSAATPTVTSTLRGQSWRGIDVWFIAADDVDLGTLPPPLNSIPYFRFEPRTRNGLSEAARRLAKLRGNRVMAARAATKSEVERMIAASQVEAIVPSRAGPLVCNISHLLGAGGTPETRTYPLQESYRAFNAAYGLSSYESGARLLGYWLTMAGIAATAYAYRTRLIDLVTSLGFASQGTAMIPFKPFIEEDQARGAFFALSAYPLVSRRATVHVDILPNEDLPESLTVQTLGSERLSQEVHVEAAHCHVRMGERIVVLPWGAGLTVTPTAFETIWTGQAIHTSFQLEVPIGSTRTNFAPRLCIKTFDNVSVTLELNFRAEETKQAIKRLVGRLANGLPGDVFISYTRRTKIDEFAAKHYADVWYAVTGRVPFLDTRTIPAGSNWRETIGTALERTAIFVLIWSAASAQSAEVAKEYEEAARLKAAGSTLEFFIVSIGPHGQPMPPLPRELSEYHVLTMPLGDP